MQRVLVAALLAVALAGCAEEPDGAPDLLGWCPQWSAGETFVLDGALDADRPEDLVFVDPVNRSAGRPLDVLRLEVDVTVDGVLLLEVEDVAAGHPAILRDHRLELGRQVQPLARFTSDGHAVLEAALNPVDADALHSGPFRLHWRLDGNGTATWSGEATAMYRVCAA